MKKLINLVLGLAISLQILTFGLPQALAVYSDVKPDARYIKDIEYIEDLGLVPESQFRPDEAITREDFAKWLLKNAGFNNENYKLKSRKGVLDVNVKNPNAPYIYRLIDLGVLELEKKGKDRLLFKPKQTITRAQALTWIFQVEGIPVPKIIDENEQFPATDIKATSTLAPLIEKAVKIGILSPGKARPTQKLKRAEAAHFLKTAQNSTPNYTVTILQTQTGTITKNSKYDIMLATWNRILESYLHKADLKEDDLMYGAIEGMVKELDDKYTTFERPGNNAVVDSLSGEVEGIGAVIEMKDEDLVIVSPLPGSPAEKGGLLPQDIIREVDGVSIKGLSLTQAVSKIKGKRGTEVKLTIERAGKTLPFAITRELIKIVSVSEKRTEDNISIITLNDFGSHAYAEFKKIIESYAVNKPAGVVLDLRNNPGGYLDVSTQIAEHFIKSGDVITIIRYPNHQEEQTSNGTGELAQYRMKVLVNGGSASASEILAGALQDYGIATIIGEKTYGKGTVQELSDFNDGSTLKMTVAEWLTPKGRSIQKNGVLPDIEVKIADEDRKSGRDPQMDKALSELRK